MRKENVRLPRKMKKALRGLKVSYKSYDDAVLFVPRCILCSFVFEVDGKVTKWHWRMFHAYVREQQRIFDKTFVHSTYLDDISELNDDIFENIKNLKREAHVKNWILNNERNGK